MLVHFGPNMPVEKQNEGNGKWISKSKTCLVALSAINLRKAKHYPAQHTQEKVGTNRKINTSASAHVCIRKVGHYIYRQSNILHEHKLGHNCLQHIHVLSKDPEHADLRT